MTVQLIRDGNQIIAMVGRNLQEGIAGCGDTGPDALRDLAQRMEAEDYLEPDAEHKPGLRRVK